ncbi:MAG TPA: RNA polymerase sigma factor [Bryobacteraceae bacterium]|nr:RNA polymerase sigma factor [Bryobacteraceae bacterium]
MEDFEATTDRDLIERFRAGDRDAFATLYRAHHPAVFRFALYMTGDRARAGEVTQDVFVWLIHHPDAFDPARGGLAPFLTGIARQFLRRRKQEDRRWLPLDEPAASRLHLSHRPAVPREISAAEDAADLWKAIASLPEPYREVVVLCDMEEMSNEKAAAALGCAVGTVWSRLNRAHALLFRKLKGKERQRCSI